MTMTAKQMGRKGGKAKGAAKRRGDAAYYRELGKKGNAAKARIKKLWERKEDPDLVYD